ELTPIGRRGDEMIRRLADRLVAVDLLDQAAELLQHQVDHRLQGAARSQVATRLAVVYLMNRKPDRTLAALRATRSADLSNELRELLRAAIGFTLAEDAIGLVRFREKYVGKMGEGPDRRAFDVVTAPVAKSGAEFRDIARAIASIDTLDAFLRDLRARYPETG